MDFDDLDDAIEARIAEEGGLSGAMAAAVGSLVDPPGKYKPKGYMQPMVRNSRIPGTGVLPQHVQAELLVKEPDRKVSIRCFLFYGPGDSYAAWAARATEMPTWMELAVHEWPGHGSREKEEPCTTIAELVEDAFKGIKFVITQHSNGKNLEGAPFAFIGHSVGAQVMLVLASKLKWELALEPACCVVLDRGPPHLPLLSELGKAKLKEDPSGFMMHYNYEVFKSAQGGGAGAKMAEQFCKDIEAGCDTRDVGFHTMQCDVLVLRGLGNTKMDEPAKMFAAYAETTLKVENSEDTLRIPVLTTTTVKDVKAAIAKIARVDTSDLSFVEIKGSQQQSQSDSDNIGREVLVKGMKGFKPMPHKWAHPTVVIGCGYQGVKTCMEYLKTGNSDITLFDRNDKVGGYCWITAANKYSKIQTEFGSFHVWWGPEYAESDLCGGWPEDWHFHASKQQVLEHFQYAADQYGVTPHCCFQTNVSRLEVVGGNDNPNRHYKLTVDSLKGEQSIDFNCSVMYNYPGSMCSNRRVVYPGEESFGGQIGYGMGDEYTWDETMKGQQVAIIGNGAFAVENIRTCCEFAAKKVFIVTRRKNLPSPRVPCWFVHQGPYPTPGRMVLKMFEPMFELCGMGDPWTYWSVHTDRTRYNVTIIQASRFGIGDVTFLAHAYGILEYVEDEMKRVSHHTLHLKSGKKVENVTGIIKSLGLLGDFSVDKLHGMKEMVGRWCAGDFRRCLAVDDPGMNAANFTTFSLGIGIYGQVKNYKYLHDNPNEYYKMEKLGIKDSLPVSKPRDDIQKPAYVTDVKYAMAVGITIGQFCPHADIASRESGAYKYALYHKVHPTDKFLAYCQEDWEKYQKMFKEQGNSHEYIPYPYTRELLQTYFDEYSATFGAKISIDGPSSDEINAMLKRNREAHKESDSVVSRMSLNADLHPGVAYPQDPMTFVDLKLAQQQRDGYTVSSKGSAMDFDFEQYEEWSKWTSGTCTIQDVEASNSTITYDPKAIEMLCDFIKKYKAPNP